MFDRSFHIHQKMPASPSHVTVNEHRAPMDDSVRLLSEMREKIVQDIIGAYPLKALNGEGVLLAVRRPDIPGGVEVYVKFMVGDNTVALKKSCDGISALRRSSPGEKPLTPFACAIHDVLDELSKSISGELVQSAYEHMNSDAKHMLDLLAN